MTHLNYTAIRIAGQDKTHLILAPLSSSVSLVNWDTGCGLPAGLGSRITKPGDGSEVCRVCADKAKKLGLLG